MRNPKNRSFTLGNRKWFSCFMILFSPIFSTILSGFGVPLEGDDNADIRRRRSSTEILSPARDRNNCDVFVIGT